MTRTSLLKKISLLSLGLVLTGYCQAQAPAATNPVKEKSASTNLASNKTTGAKGVLWEIKSKSNTAYMFGSIHLAKADFYPLPKAAEQAYQRAQHLVVEVDVSDPGIQQKSMPLFSYQAPDKLQNHVKEATWQKLTGLLGPNAENLQSIKPAIAATALSLVNFRQLGYDPAKGIDLHFLQKAKADKKTVIALETVEFQAGVLGSLSDDEGDDVLSYTLDAIKSGEILHDSEAMVNAWRQGDAEGLAKILYETAQKNQGSKRIMKLLLDDRNVGMSEKIIDLLNAGKKIFIVVGAGHTTGENSIIDLLQKQGLQVRQVK